MHFVIVFDRILRKVSRAGLFVAFCVLIIAVLTQTLGRLVGMAPVWTEELTRFALIYIAAFGIGIALVTGHLVNVDAVCNALPEPIPRYLRMVSSIACVGLSALLLDGAVEYTQIGVLQKSPALGVRMDLMHVSLVLMLVMLLLFALMRLIIDLFRMKT